MKILIVTVLFFASALIGGDTQLPVNEEGKITFKEEVEVGNMPKDALFRNALNYADKVKKESERKTRTNADFTEGLIRKESSFYVYTNGLFTPQIHGEIIYNLRIEVEKGKYTYTFTDFIFQHYRKNRYGVYAPVSGKIKPLEEERYAGMQDTWEEHKALTREHVEHRIRALKNKMKEVPAGAFLEEETPNKASN